MRGHRALVVGAALAGALVLAVALSRHGGMFQREAAPGPAAAEGGLPGDVARTDAGDGTGPPSPAGDARLPLPELDVPLRLVADDLRRRAEAGDAPAACRLAAEFERCRMLRTQIRRDRSSRRRMESHLDRAAEQEIERYAQALAGMDESLAAREAELRHCEGVEEPAAGERARYWRRAALAGHLPAMRHYAIGNAFRFGDLMTALPELELYRREAEAVARRAAMAGDASMMHALAMAYLPRDRVDDERYGSGFRPFLAQSVQPDPRQALAWMHALQRHPGVQRLPQEHPMRALPAREIDGLASRLAAAEAAAAAAAADDWARTWTPAAAETVRVPVHVNGGIGEVSREECEPG